MVDGEPSETLLRRGRLSPAEVDAVLRLQAQAQHLDGGPPLNDAAVVALRRPDPGVQHFLVVDSSGALLGYGQLDGVSGTVAVGPAFRRGGIGTRLVRELLTQARSGLQIWAVGDSPAAAALAAATGLRAERTLLIMSRPLDEPVPAVKPAAGITVRTFVPGRDEDAWLALNAKAFRHHPEQGSLTRTDLALRMAEPWFDAGGFFLASQTAAGGDALVGFHWTKRHPDRLGEVYVLGVDPESGGRGLGKALLSIGLRHLQDEGDLAVQLYVEADHERAVGLYRASGFVEVSRDVMYAQASAADAP